MCLAVVGVLRIDSTGTPVYDAVGSIAIGETESLLIGESALPGVRDGIEAYLVACSMIARGLRSRTEPRFRKYAGSSSIGHRMNRMIRPGGPEQGREIHGRSCAGAGLH